VSVVAVRRADVYKSFKDIFGTLDRSGICIRIRGPDPLFFELHLGNFNFN
jgi:hypothetical protein